MLRGGELDGDEDDEDERVVLLSSRTQTGSSRGQQKRKAEADNFRTTGSTTRTWKLEPSEPCFVVLLTSLGRVESTAVVVQDYCVIFVDPSALKQLRNCDNFVFESEELLLKSSGNHCNNNSEFRNCLAAKSEVQ